MKETFKVSLITIFSIIIISLIVNLSDIEPVKKAVSELYLNSIDYNVVMNKEWEHGCSRNLGALKQ